MSQRCSLGGRNAVRRYFRSRVLAAGGLCDAFGRAEVRGLDQAALCDLSRRALEEQSAEVEHVDITAHAHDEGEVVLDKQDAAAALGHDAAQDPRESLCLCLVQAAGRL